MDRSEKRGYGAEDRLPLSETQLRESHVNPSRKLDLTRCLAKIIGNPKPLWMSLAAILRWVHPHLLVKREGDFEQSDLKDRRYDHPQRGPSRLREKKKGSTLFSMGTELFLGVGMNLLKRQVKSWSLEINAARTSRNGILCSVPPGTDRIIETEPKGLTVENSQPEPGTAKKNVWLLLKTTAMQWVNDKCPQTGAALAYFTVFSLAPLILILLAFFGL